MQGRDLLTEFAFLPRLDRDMHLPLAQVAVDAVAGDERSLQAQAFNGDLPDASCIGGADQRLQFVLPAGDSRDRLGAAATRSAPPDAVRLEQYDAVAAFSEVQRSGATCDTATDHADIGLDIAFQCPTQRLRRRRGGVPGVDVRAQIAPMYHSISSGVT